METDSPALSLTKKRRKVLCSSCKAHGHRSDDKEFHVRVGNLWQKWAKSKPRRKVSFYLTGKRGRRRPENRGSDRTAEWIVSVRGPGKYASTKALEAPDKVTSALKEIQSKMSVGVQKVPQTDMVTWSRLYASMAPFILICQSELLGSGREIYFPIGSSI